MSFIAMLQPRSAKEHDLPWMDLFERTFYYKDQRETKKNPRQPGQLPYSVIPSEENCTLPNALYRYKMAWARCKLYAVQ